jgi:hypothetical protein
MPDRFSATPGEAISIEVRPEKCPDGKWRVLLQLPDGFVLIPVDDAEYLALELNHAASKIRGL